MLKFFLLIVPLWAHAMVIGLESRQFVAASTTLPYSAVGVVEVMGQASCSGTLVKRDVVLTASHCVKGYLTAQIRYISQYQYGAAAGDSSVVLQVTQGDGSRGGDWALLKLAKPLGDSYGVLKTAALPSRELHASVIRVAGYDLSHSFTENYGLSLMVNKVFAHIKELMPSGALAHDAPTGPGVSGAPLIREKDGAWTVIGISVSEARRAACRIFNKTDCYNLGVQESAWRSALQSM